MRSSCWNSTFGLCRRLGRGVSTSVDSGVGGAKYTFGDMVVRSVVTEIIENIGRAKRDRSEFVDNNREGRCTTDGPLSMFPRVNSCGPCLRAAD